MSDAQPPERAPQRSLAVRAQEAAAMTIVQSELVVGGQKSRKSRRAQDLAMRWLQGAASRRAVLIAMAVAHDPDMRARIRRHQVDREQQAPRLASIEVPLGRASRAFVDALGGLNQAVARACARVTMMASGLPLVLKAPL